MNITEKRAKLRVLFLCVANSCRSQMAEGLIRHYLGEYFDVESAGYMATFVHPYAIKVMNEIGIDIREHRSKAVSEFYRQKFDIVITVCDESDAICPVWIGDENKVHIGFPDPVRARGTEDEVLNVFRLVRDQMKEKLIKYLSDAYPNQYSINERGNP